MSLQWLRPPRRPCVMQCPSGHVTKPALRWSKDGVHLGAFCRKPGCGRWITWLQQTPAWLKLAPSTGTAPTKTCCRLPSAPTRWVPDKSGSRQTVISNRSPGRIR